MNNHLSPKQKWKIAFRLARVCKGPLNKIPFGLGVQAGRALDGLNVYQGRFPGSILMMQNRKRIDAEFGRPIQPMCRCTYVTIKAPLP